MAALAAGSDLVVVRILGVRRQYEEMLAPLLAGPAPVVVLGGEQVPDAELMELSTVPMGVATEAHGYLAQGGPDNLAQLHRFLADTVLLDGEGFEPPSVAPEWGVLDRAATRHRPDASPSCTTGRTTCPGTPPSSRRCAPRSRTPAAGRCRCSPPRCAPSSPAWSTCCARADALVVTVLAAGGSQPATAQAGGDDGAWDVGELATLDVPVVQGLCLTSSRADWAASDDGLSPLDVGNQVAIPEFDGRLISVPFSLQGDRRRRADLLRRRPRAGRPGGRHGGRARPAAAHAARPSAGSW